MIKRLFGLIALLMTSLLVLVACDTGEGPDLIVEMEVTREVTRVVVVTATPSDGIAVAEATDSADGPLPVGSPDSELTPDAEQTNIPTPESTATAEPTAGPTATPDAFPTPIVGQITVAEQTFQNGTMFWLQPIDQIWVATTNSEGEQIWINRDDDFEEGMPESDESLEPPAEGLIQPIRGFGLLWRSEDELQNTLGWATNEEFGYTTNYEYHWGGTVDDNNVYTAGPGYHLIETLNRNVYRFDEETRTWEIIRQSE
ncbi:MAG: hypothetical protein AAFR67_03355 [Chloroflexota bacterium]